VLAFEPPEPGIMERPPRTRDASLLTPLLLWRVVFVSCLFAGVALLIFFGAQSLGATVEKARTLTVNMLVLAEIAYLFNVRFLHMRSLTLKGALGTRPVLIALAIVTLAQLAFTYLPFLQIVFETVPLTLLEGAIIIAIGFGLLLLLEAEKLLISRFAP
jgi:magnesium-transporting ATPase (P-type)